MAGERHKLTSDFSSQPDKQSFLLYHRFGVNYVPSRNWYFCYNDWNPEDIRHDLDAIASLGADHIRLMVIWPWFQPNPTSVSARHLDYLEQIIDFGAERGLDVLVTLFTGWLSGYHFNPPYLESEPFFYVASLGRRSGPLPQRSCRAYAAACEFPGF
jgi:sugar phosphate isomerase/epimerase